MSVIKTLLSAMVLFSSAPNNLLDPVSYEGDVEEIEIDLPKTMQDYLDEAPEPVIIEEIVEEIVVEEVVIEEIVIEEEVVPDIIVPAVEYEEPVYEEIVYEEPVVTGEGVGFPVEYNFFSYMDYRAITNQNAPQWEYRVNGWTREDGVRMYGDYIQVAMGTPYGNVGDKFRLTTDVGTFNIILGDSKGDVMSHGTSQVEIIVADDVMGATARRDGNLNNIFGDNVYRLEVIE